MSPNDQPLRIELPGQSDAEEDFSSSPALRSASSIGITSESLEEPVARPKSSHSIGRRRGFEHVSTSRGFAADLQQSRQNAKQHADAQLRTLLLHPLLAEEGGGGEAGPSWWAPRRKRSEEQAAALAELRKMCISFLEFKDMSGSVCQQLLRRAQQLREPLSALVAAPADARHSSRSEPGSSSMRKSESINLSTLFIFSVTTYARLLALQQPPGSPGAESSTADDASSLHQAIPEAAEAEDKPAPEKVLHDFYERWKQSGEEMNQALRVRALAGVSGPPKMRKRSISAAAACSSARASESSRHRQREAPHTDGPPAVRAAETPVPQRLGIRAALMEPKDTPPTRTSLCRLVDSATAPTPPAEPKESADERTMPRISFSEPTEAVHMSASDERDSATPSRVSSTSRACTPSYLRRQSSTMSARPQLLCRICEAMVDMDKMEGHSQQCLREVILVTADRTTSTLQQTLERELRENSLSPGKAESGSKPLAEVKVRWKRNSNSQRDSCGSTSVSERHYSGSPESRRGGANEGSLDLELINFEERQQQLLEQLLGLCKEVRASGLTRDHQLETMRQKSREVFQLSRRYGLSRVSTSAEQLLGCISQLQTFWSKMTDSSSDTPLRWGATADPKTSAEPVTIDSFEILKPISRGAYGQVVLAAKKTTQDLYAIKVIKKRDTRRKNNVRRIMTERDVLATAEHPFVVRLFYSFQTKENLYMVMEFVNGGDLFSLLKNLGYLDEDTARLYVAEICLALEYLHYELGVVHRDLKPDNVLIHKDGHIKLTDFGLSAFGLAEVDPAGTEEVQAEDSDDEQMELRQKVGTPDYMAPELLLGEKHGRPVDLWALGCLTFELLTGYTPFTGDSVQEVFEHILEHSSQDAIRWPEEEDHLTPASASFCGEMLNPVPEARLGASSSKDLYEHPFFDNVEWELLRGRQGEVPFVPELNNRDDTSYFVSKIPTDRHSRMSRAFAASSTSESIRQQRFTDEEEEDFDFANFTYSNLATLMQKNLELARGTRGEAGSSSPCSMSSQAISTTADPGCGSTNTSLTASARDESLKRHCEKTSDMGSAFSNSPASGSPLLAAFVDGSAYSPAQRRGAASPREAVLRRGSSPSGPVSCLRRTLIEGLRSRSLMSTVERDLKCEDLAGEAASEPGAPTTPEQPDGHSRGPRKAAT